jgi:hypothetical protein
VVKEVQWPSPEIHRIDFARRIAEAAIVLEDDAGRMNLEVDRVGDYAKRACFGKTKISHVDLVQLLQNFQIPTDRQWFSGETWEGPRIHGLRFMEVKLQVLIYDVGIA